MSNQRQNACSSWPTRLAVARVLPLALALLVYPTPDVARQRTGESRIHANRPAVVSFRAPPCDVETAAPNQRPQSRAKSVKRIEASVRATGRAVITFAGWLLDLEGIVPGKRERQKDNQSRGPKP